MFICDWLSGAEYALIVFKDKEGINVLPLDALSIPKVVGVTMLNSPKYKGSYVTSAIINEDEALEKLKEDLKLNKPTQSPCESTAVSQGERDIYENKINSLLDNLSHKQAELTATVRDYKDLDKKYNELEFKYNALMDIVNKFTDFIIIDEDNKEASDEIEDYDDVDNEWETIYP